MGGELAANLKRRARGFLEEARRVSDPDLAAFFAEQAMQLYVKAVLLQVAGETARAHELRALLGLLARRLREAGFASELRLLRGLSRIIVGSLLPPRRPTYLPCRVLRTILMRGVRQRRW